MLKASSNIQAYFKLVAVDSGTNNQRELTDWFPNLVLNSGLDRMSQGAWIDRVMVGSGNSVPLISQTSLDNFVSSTTNITTYTSTRQLTNLPYYYSIQSTFRFAQGAAAGNLSEIGMGWANNACWNRALIRDLNGDPTTITVRSNEFLDVLTELRIYPHTDDVVSVVDLKDGDGNTISTHTVTVRPNMHANLTHSSADRLFATQVRLADSIGSRSNSISVRNETGLLNGIGANITGGITFAATGIAANDAYPTIRTCTYKVPVSISLGIGQHKVIAINSRLGDWKLEYNPPISKDATQTMEHNFMLSWDRHTP